MIAPILTAYGGEGEGRLIRTFMGTIINAIAILIGGASGLLFRKRFPERIAQTTLQVLGLFTLVVGVNMALQLFFLFFSFLILFYIKLGRNSTINALNNCIF